MADVLGAIAASDQLIRNFSSAYKQLAKAYRIIKYARKDIRQAKKRTKTIQEIFRFFKQTMEDVFQIDEFSVDLREYQQFYNGLNKHARKLVDKILNVIKSLRPILKRGTISMWTKLQTRWRWLVQDREALRLVYEEMGLLAGFMGFFMNLVRLQIAAKQYMLQKSAATKVQIDGLERTLNAQLEDIKHRMKSLGPTERSMISRENGDLLKEIRRIIRKEVKRIPRPGAAEDSTSGASSPSSLPPEPPSTPPTEPDNPDENQSNSEPTDKEINLTSSQPVSSTPSPAISPGLHPINLFPDSEASYVTIDQMSPQNKPNVANSSPAPTHLPLYSGHPRNSIAPALGEYQVIFLRKHHIKAILVAQWLETTIRDTLRRSLALVVHYMGLQAGLMKAHHKTKIARVWHAE
ncbi:hypothetical protein BDV19DRAFT_395574 [Aspergillus venezuelensis]